MMSFKIVTLGCRVNQYESAYIEERLLKAGWGRAGSAAPGDVVVINTCTVTQAAAHQSRQEVRKAVRQNPGAFVVVTGCHVQVHAEEMTSIAGVGMVYGNHAKGQLPDRVLEAIKLREEAIPLREVITIPSAIDPMSLSTFSERARAHLKIQDGCQSFCSYCIVPFARGPCRSLSPRDVMGALRGLAERGYGEVVLTGIHLGKYGADLGESTDLYRLLTMVREEKLPLRIRLSSLEPTEIHEDLIDLVAAEPWLCRHFHIPLQSGDRGILRAMNRHYAPDDFARLVSRIKEKIPMAGIGADVMAGFPGEDERAFENTFSLIRDLPVSYLHVFPFSRRKGTAACELDHQIPPHVIKSRAARLRALGSEKRAAFYGSCVGHTFMVVSEGWRSEEKGLDRGMTDNYVPVRFPSSQTKEGEFVAIKVEQASRDGVTGTCLNVPDHALPQRSHHDEVP
jgi:threonylcarbamoyladenosine tRNA methylthiotransferase MtaB